MIKQIEQTKLNDLKPNYFCLVLQTKRSDFERLLLYIRSQKILTDF